MSKAIRLTLMLTIFLALTVEAYADATITRIIDRRTVSLPQLLTVAAGGDVYKRKKPEVGWTSIEKVMDDPLLTGVTSPFVAFNWHQYSCRLPATSHLTARRGEGVQAFRAGGKAWATQFHPEIDAAMAPHWVEDAAKEHHEQGADWIEQLRADTERYLPTYPALCRRITENFVLTCGLLPTD